MTSRFLASAAVLAAMPATPLAAQVLPAPLESPSPAPTMPAAVATPPVGAGAVRPPVAVTLPPPPVAQATPVVRATPTARATPTPRPTASSTPTAGATSTATPAPVATPVPSPTPAAADAAPSAMVAGRPASALPRVEETGALWALPVSGGLVAGLVLMALLIRRRRRRALAGEGEDIAVAADVAAAPDAPATPEVLPPPLPRAGVSLTLRPRRAGVNLLTATLDAEIVVRNVGDTAADDVHVVLRLLSARGRQEEELAAIFGDAAARPAAPPFALAPGEERVVAALATCARHDLNVVTAGDRPMFVPVAVVSVRYVDGDRPAQVARAFALGVERAGAEKLGPFWLDAPSRMHDAVGVRPYAPEVWR